MLARDRATRGCASCGTRVRRRRRQPQRLRGRAPAASTIAWLDSDDELPARRACAASWRCWTRDPQVAARARRLRASSTPTAASSPAGPRRSTATRSSRGRGVPPSDRRQRAHHLDGGACRRSRACRRPARSTHRSGPAARDWDMWLRLALRGRRRLHGRAASPATASTPTRSRMRTPRAVSGCAATCASVERVLGRDARADRRTAPARAAASRRAGRASAAARGRRLYRAAAAATALRAVELAGRARPPRRRGSRRCSRRPRAATTVACMTADARGARRACRATARPARALRRERSPRPRATTRAGTRDSARPGATVARVTPGDAVIAAIAKWDPTLLASCRARRPATSPTAGCMPDGYPRDGAEAVAHLDALLRAARRHAPRRHRASSGWWLDHYPELASTCAVSRLLRRRRRLRDLRGRARMSGRIVIGGARRPEAAPRRPRLAVPPVPARLPAARLGRAVRRPARG